MLDIHEIVVSFECFWVSEKSEFEWMKWKCFPENIFHRTFFSFQVESNFADISHVQRRRKEMEILEEMNRKKRELEEAQRNYANIQRERYLAEGQDSD